MTQQRPGSGSTADLDDFLVGELRGEGAAAVVHAAVHLRFQITVALKLWHRPLDQETRQRFDEECRLQWRLSEHPQIVRLFWAHAQDGERPWTASELYEYSLADRLGRGPLDLPAALDIADDLLAGLSAVHAAGALHRDVKPANILIKNGRAALGDFGIAIDGDDLPRDRAAGTARYLAPELERGAEPSTRSDVYSAAVTIEAALGQVPDWLESTLIRATSHHPEDRHSDAAALRGAIADKRAQHVGDRIQVSTADGAAVTDGGVHIPSRAPRRRRSVLFAGAAAVSALITGGAALMGAQLLIERTADATPSAGKLEQPRTPAETTAPTTAPKTTLPSGVPSVSASSGQPTISTAEASATDDGLAVPVPDEATKTTTAPPRGAKKLPTSGQVPTGPKKPTEYQIQSLFASKCVDVVGPSTHDGTPLQLWDCNNVPEERWVFDGRHVRGFGGKCLDVRGPSTDNGTPVQLWRCENVPQQKWTLEPSGELRVFDTKCLDVQGPSRATGTPLQIWDCEGVPQQKWRRF